MDSTVNLTVFCDGNPKNLMRWSVFKFWYPKSDTSLAYCKEVKKFFLSICRVSVCGKKLDKCRIRLRTYQKLTVFEKLRVSKIREGCPILGKVTKNWTLFSTFFFAHFLLSKRDKNLVESFLESLLEASFCFKLFGLPVWTIFWFKWH